MFLKTIVFQGEFDCIIEYDGYRGVDTLVWGTARVFGVDNPVSSVTVNGGKHYDYTYNTQTKVQLYAQSNDTSD